MRVLLLRLEGASVRSCSRPAPRKTELWSTLENKAKQGREPAGLQGPAGRDGALLRRDAAPAAEQDRGAEPAGRHLAERPGRRSRGEAVPARGREPQGLLRGAADQDPPDRRIPRDRATSRAASPRCRASSRCTTSRSRRLAAEAATRSSAVCQAISCSTSRRRRTATWTMKSRAGRLPASAATTSRQASSASKKGAAEATRQRLRTHDPILRESPCRSPPLAALAGCSNDIDELQAQVAEVKSRPGGRIDPLPEVKPYETFNYAARPVSVHRSIQGMPASATTPNSVRPDITRPREFLEQFSLDTLRMVGTLKLQGRIYGLSRHRTASYTACCPAHRWARAMAASRPSTKERSRSSRSCPTAWAASSSGPPH